MNNMMNKLFLFLGLLMCSFSASAVSLVNCSGVGNEPSENFKKHVCVPLQKEADQLLNKPEGRARAAEPILMTQKLNIQEYRDKGIAAVVQFSKGQSAVNSSTANTNSTSTTGGTGSTSETPWFLGQ